MEARSLCIEANGYPQTIVSADKFMRARLVWLWRAASSTVAIPAITKWDIRLLHQCVARPRMSAFSQGQSSRPGEDKIAAAGADPVAGHHCLPNEFLGGCNQVSHENVGLQWNLDSTKLSVTDALQGHSWLTV